MPRGSRRTLRSPARPVKLTTMHWLFGLTIATAIVGCGDNRVVGDASTSAPPFRNPVALPDAELAMQALQILGAEVAGAQPACNACHGLTADRLRFWGSLSDRALATCLTDLEVSSAESARSMLDCMRAMPAVPGSDFEARKLGVFTSAARLPWFDYVFDVAYGPAPTERTAFEALAAMPRGTGTNLTQAQFDIVAEWFVRGLPALAQTLVADPPPSACVPSISSAVGDHITAMATQGWRAKNAQLAMFAVDAEPLAIDQPFGMGWEVIGRLRVLRDVSYTTSFWTRSSADGRFVAHGVANVPGSYVIDLQRDAEISIDAQYDPAFFPDHSGFMFQGGPGNTCPISVLTSNPDAIAMTEPGCRANDEIGLYQHVGRSLDGGDLFALDSQFVSDDGGKLPTLGDPLASFTGSARSSFTPLIATGDGFVPRPRGFVATPFEGDTVLAPSSRLTIARLAGPSDRQLGYVLRAITATPAGSSYALTAEEIAQYCVAGGKPAFSYDERWIAFHHYIEPADAVDLGFSGPGDPAFAPYLSLGGANLYVMDLATGIPQRVTNMHAGQYALYPHFRSDGWLYGEVRDSQAGCEYTIASDAVRVLE